MGAAGGEVTVFEDGGDIAGFGELAGEGFGVEDIAGGGEPKLSIVDVHRFDSAVRARVGDKIRFSMTNRESPDQMVRDGLSNTTQHPFNESSSPPSPTELVPTVAARVVLTPLGTKSHRNVAGIRAGR